MSTVPRVSLRRDRASFFFSSFRVSFVWLLSARPAPVPWCGSILAWPPARSNGNGMSAGLIGGVRIEQTRAGWSACQTPDTEANVKGIEVFMPFLDWLNPFTESQKDHFDAKVTLPTAPAPRPVVPSPVPVWRPRGRPSPVLKRAAARCCTDQLVFGEQEKENLHWLPDNLGYLQHRRDFLSC